MAKRSREEYELGDETKAAVLSGSVTVETVPSSRVKQEAAPVVAALKSEGKGDDDAPIAFVGRTRHGDRIKCPYLDTINRPLLDFDFEKVCSISLSNHNVYGCLVCGKFFQGRGQHTHAYTHSVQASHHVFINLHNGKVYCLPDLYEVVDSSLDDIRYALSPTYTPEEIAMLDKQSTLATDVMGVQYLPGYMGLNNLKCTDYVNVLVQALCRVKPLRTFLCDHRKYETNTSPLVHRFGELMRKLWSPRNFKSTVSPHELLQEIVTASKKRFKIGTQCEAVDLLSWFLNQLETDLNDAYAKVPGVQTRPADLTPETNVIRTTFRGEVEVTTTTFKSDVAGEPTVETTRTAFLYLSMELPPVPLFKDDEGGNVIPQVPLFTVLKKFDGVTHTEVLKGGVRQRKTYRITKLPEYLILHMKRFTKNNWFLEKNPTIVNFPLTNLEMKPCKPKIRVIALRSRPVYDLVANICHDSSTDTEKKTVASAAGENPLTAGSYRAHVKNDCTGQWYEMQDLHVQETMPQLIGLSESYLLFYRLQE